MCQIHGNVMNQTHQIYFADTGTKQQQHRRRWQRRQKLLNDLNENLFIASCKSLDYIFDNPNINEIAL